MGSLGLEFITKIEWNPSDIDIHVLGDPRGWEAPDYDRIYDWDKILKIMGVIGYDLIDIHEHEFQKSEISVEYVSISSLHDFAGIYEADIDFVNFNGIEFRIPSQEQFLKIYEESSKDSYRNDNNNNKDFAKIDFLRRDI